MNLVPGVLCRVTDSQHMKWTSLGRIESENHNVELHPGVLLLFLRFSATSSKISIVLTPQRVGWMYTAELVPISSPAACVHQSSQKV